MHILRWAVTAKRHVVGTPHTRPLFIQSTMPTTPPQQRTHPIPSSAYQTNCIFHVPNYCPPSGPRTVAVPSPRRPGRHQDKGILRKYVGNITSNRTQNQVSHAHESHPPPTCFIFSPPPLYCEHWRITSDHSPRTQMRLQLFERSSYILATPHGVQKQILSQQFRARLSASCAAVCFLITQFLSKPAPAPQCLGRLTIFVTVFPSSGVAEPF